MVKALAPLFIAFSVHDELRLTATGYMKQIVAYALRGVLSVLLLGLIPILTANDYPSFESLEDSILADAGAITASVMTCFNLILKYVTVITLLIDSQGLIKRLVGVM